MIFRCLQKKEEEEVERMEMYFKDERIHVFQLKLQNIEHQSRPLIHSKVKCIFRSIY